MSNDKTGRTCIFCGATGNLTKEHVLRKKWQSYFGREPEGLLDRHTYPNLLGGPPKQVHNSYRGISFERQVKAVCKVCNNGWLNDLENAAESILLRLMRGEPIHLGSSEMELVTRWIAKTSFVMEMMDTSPKAASKDQRRAVMEGHHPAHFHAFMFPLLPNRETRLRSTPRYSPDGSHNHVFRFSTIHVHQIHFLSITSSDDIAEQHMQVLYARNVLESPTWPIKEGIDWPNRQPAPVVAVQQLHDLVSGVRLNS